MQAITETTESEACFGFGCGLARDNVEYASELVASGKAALRISVYPWGAELDLVEPGSMHEIPEENSVDEV